MSELITAREIVKHIEQLERLGAGYHAKIHQVGISCLAIVARDGQISPLNRFHGILSDRYQAAWKAYVRETAGGFMTMKHGEFVVRKDTKVHRDAFLGRVTDLLEENFLDLKLEPRIKREFNERVVLKRIGSLIRAVDREIEKNPAVIAPDIRELLDRFFDEVEAAVKEHERRPRRARRSAAAKGEIAGAHATH